MTITAPGNSPRAVITYGVGRRVGLALFLMALMIGGVGSWAVMTDLAGAVIAHGTVVVDRHSKRVQHRDGGIVAAINVKNGDSVKENDILLRLDETQLRAELQIVQSQLTELKGRRARLAAEQELAQHLEFAPDFEALPAAQAIVAGERKLFLHNKKMRESQEKQLRQRIEQLEQERAGHGIQRKAKAAELTLIRKELANTRTLFEKNLTPANKLIAQEREETRIDGDRGSLMAQEARVSGQISEVEQQILTMQQTVRTEAQKELRTADARIDELTERHIAATDRLGRLEIRAPQSGVVHELVAHTVGGVVSPAEQIMLIVPAEEKLAIEVKVSPADIDQVRLHQETRLRFTSFNQRTTPELPGIVTYVSADVSRDPKDRQEFYLVRAQLAGDKPSSLADKSIVPGMPVEVFVTTEKRTALSYLSKPIVDQFSRAFRER